MQDFNISQVETLLTQVLSSDKSLNEDAALRLAGFLSDDFADENDEIAWRVRGIINRTLENKKLPERLRNKLKDSIDVALARVDLRYSLEYWLRDDHGKPITLTTIQLFWLDFIRYAHEEVMVPIIFAPMGTGKSSILTGMIAFEIGQNPDILEQLICSTDKPAELRGIAIKAILGSPHYRKVYPKIVPDPITQKWTSHELLVERSKADITQEIRRDTQGDSGSIDLTLACYGITSGALGSRSHRSNFDDIATPENSIEEPTKGKHIHTLLTTKWFTRKKSPVGVAEADYDRKNNPWRARIIGTPWAYDDPIYSLRDWHAAAVVLIGVNADISAYNVQIWNLPKKYIKRLKDKYYSFDYTEDLKKIPGKGKVHFADGTTHKLGVGVPIDKQNPPTATMELPLSRPRQWYQDEYRDAKDIKRDFDRPYRCEVYTEGELAYPGFENSVVKTYPNSDTKIFVDIEAINSGWLASVVDPPKEYKLKVAMVDLSGANRAGTVITTAVLSMENRKRLVEMACGAWGPKEITDQIDQLFARHPDLDTCFVESVSLQSLYVGALQNYEEKYAWAAKIGSFDATQTSKHDAEIGILTIGIPLNNGGFEIPDTRGMRGHAVKDCPCGFCRLIKDGTTQTRLSPVKSDVLITLWGIHLCIPHSVDIDQTQPPTIREYAKNGYELFKEFEISSVGKSIFGGMIASKQGSTPSGIDPENTGQSSQSSILVGRSGKGVDEGWR